MSLTDLHPPDVYTCKMSVQMKQSPRTASSHDDQASDEPDVAGQGSYSDDNDDDMPSLVM